MLPCHTRPVHEPTAQRCVELFERHRVLCIVGVVLPGWQQNVGAGLNAAMRYLRKPTTPILALALLALMIGPLAAMGRSCVPGNMAACAAQSVTLDTAHPIPSGLPGSTGCDLPGDIGHGIPMPADACAVAHSPAPPSALRPAGTELRVRAVQDHAADARLAPVVTVDDAGTVTSCPIPHTPARGPLYHVRPDAGRAPPAA